MAVSRLQIYDLGAVSNVSERTFVMDAANSRQLTAGTTLVVEVWQTSSATRDWRCEDATNAVQFTKIDEQVISGRYYVMFYLDNITGGDTDIRVYEASAGGPFSANITAQIREYDGLDNGTDSLAGSDANVEASNTTTHPCGATGVSLGSNGGVIVAGGVTPFDANNRTPATDFAEDLDDTNFIFSQSLETTGSRSSETGTYTTATARTSANIIAAFNAAGGGGGGTGFKGLTLLGVG